MPLRSIVIIVLRLFSLSWLLQGLIAVAVTDAAMASLTAPNYVNYAMPAGYIVAAVLLWAFASVVARLVTPDPDTTVQVGGLTRFDLYCFAFVFLGLYFVLSSAATAMSSLHFHLIVAKTIPPSDLPQKASLYQLAEPLLTLIAGGLCIVFSSRLARKLTDTQHKVEPAKGQAP